MIGRRKKGLIQYSQYFDKETMEMTTNFEREKRLFYEEKYLKAVDGDDQSVKTTMPRAILYIANEMQSLGHAYIKKHLSLHSQLSDSNQSLLDLDSFMDALASLQYMASTEDRGDCRTYFLNNELFVDAPKYYRKE